MKAGKAFTTAICAILVGATGSLRVLGQIAPMPLSPLADSSGDSQPPSSAATAGPLQDAGGDDAGFGQPCCGSRWTASADFIILDRIGTVPYALVSTSPSLNGPNTEVLNATDLHHGFSGGSRLDLMHHGDGDGDLEFSYFQIDGWSSCQSTGPLTSGYLVMMAPGNFIQRQDDFQHIGVSDQSMAWAYTSRLYNAELNMRWNPWRQVTVLAGFRWAEVMEELQGILSPPGTSGSGPFWDTQTKNNLYGLQIGAEAKLFERGRFSMGGVLKAGAYDNHVEEASSARMARIWFGDSCTTDHFAFLGEIGLQCKYQVLPRLSLKAGYEALWLEGIALAPGQIAETHCHYDIVPQNAYVQSMGVNCNSGAFYHGATVGLEYSF